MRNISFQLTTQQVKNRTKTVTRRLKWLGIQSGTLLQGCRKCMGLKLGESPEKIAVIRVLNVRREPLNSLVRHAEVGTLKVAIEGAYFLEEAQLECQREGFPEMSPTKFVEMFCEHMQCSQDAQVTRIEFEYV
jgi:hypothetical protein